MFKEEIKVTVHKIYCSYTVLYCLQIKKILKMSLIVLFIYLKIILLQYFQFSISATINSI